MPTENSKNLMTEQNAADYIADWVEYMESDGLCLPSREPFDMAVKALREVEELRRKYSHSVVVLASIANRSGADPDHHYVDEWTQARAFRDCNLAAKRGLKYIGEDALIKHYQ